MVPVDSSERLSRGYSPGVTSAGAPGPGTHPIRSSVGYRTASAARNDRALGQVNNLDKGQALHLGHRRCHFNGNGVGVLGIYHRVILPHMELMSIRGEVELELVEDEDVLELDVELLDVELELVELLVEVEELLVDELLVDEDDVEELEVEDELVLLDVVDEEEDELASSVYVTCTCTMLQYMTFPFETSFCSTSASRFWMSAQDHHSRT